MTLSPEGEGAAPRGRAGEAAAGRMREGGAPSDARDRATAPIETELALTIHVVRGAARRGSSVRVRAGCVA